MGGWPGFGVDVRGVTDSACRASGEIDGIGLGWFGGNGGCGVRIVQPARIVRARRGGALAAGFRGCWIGDVPLFAGWCERVG